MYLITAKYSDDAERKRIEYVLEKWSQKAGVRKPDGIVVIVENDREVAGLLEELYSRTSADNVNYYRLEKDTKDIEPKEAEREIRRLVPANRDKVDEQFRFIMAKQRATLKVPGANYQNIYQVVSKKGKAEIDARLLDNDGSTELIITISGYGEVVEFIYKKLDDEVKYLGGL